MASFSFNSSKSCSILGSILLDSVHLFSPKLFRSQIFTHPCSSNWRLFKGGATVICTNGKTWVFFSFYTVVWLIIDGAFDAVFFYEPIFSNFLFLFHHLYMVWLFVLKCFCLFGCLDYYSRILCCLNDCIIGSLCYCLDDISLCKLLIARVWDWFCLVLTGKTQRKNSPTVDSDDDSSVSSSSTMRSDRMSVVGIEDFQFDKDTLLDQALDALYEKRYSFSSWTILRTNYFYSEMKNWFNLSCH